MSKSQDEFLEEYDTESYSSRFYDQESELIRFYSQNVRQIYFKYIPIGSYSLTSNTWLWSWENNGSIEKYKEDTLIVKELGQRNGLEFLSKGLFEWDQTECRKLTAISKNF